MNKIVINHLDKTFVTSDASIMMTELEVQHPAAKLVVMAAKAQESEIGDGTNLVRPHCAIAPVLLGRPSVVYGSACGTRARTACCARHTCDAGSRGQLSQAH